MQMACVLEVDNTVNGKSDSIAFWCSTNLGFFWGGYCAGCTLATPAQYR